MFPFLRTKLFLVIVIAAVVGTFYYFGDPQKLAETIIPKLKETPLAPAVEKIETLNPEQITEQFQNSVQNTESEIGTLSERTAEVSQHAGKVLSSSVTAPAKEETTPVHEKAFEYGKYIYCKQVVSDYETQNPSLKEE